MTYGPQSGPCYDEARTYPPGLWRDTPPLHQVERGPGGEAWTATTKESTGWHGQAVS